MATGLKKFTLSKAKKIKSKKKIEQIFAIGIPIFEYPFRILYLKTPLTPNINNTQFCCGASKRNFKKAVDRNKIKRLTREAYRLNQFIIENKNDFSLDIFFQYIGKTILPFSEIEVAVIKILNKLDKV